MTTKRAKGTREIVRDIFVEHPDWNAKQIYDRYLILVGDTRNAVTLNAIQKHLETLKPIMKSFQDSGLESPWSISARPLAEIPPDCVSILIDIQRQMIKHRVKKKPGFWSSKEANSPLTIREALWAARLYTSVISMIKRRFPDFLNSDEIAKFVLMTARAYSESEKLSSLNKNQRFDTTELDHLFFVDDISFHRRKINYRKASLEEIDQANNESLAPFFNRMESLSSWFKEITLKESKEGGK